MEAALLQSSVLVLFHVSRVSRVNRCPCRTQPGPWPFSLLHLVASSTTRLPAIYAPQLQFYTMTAANMAENENLHETARSTTSSHFNITGRARRAVLVLHVQTLRQPESAQTRARAPAMVLVRTSFWNDLHGGHLGGGQICFVKEEKRSVATLCSASVRSSLQG